METYTDFIRRASSAGDVSDRLIEFYYAVDQYSGNTDECVWRGVDLRPIIQDIHELFVRSD